MNLLLVTGRYPWPPRRGDQMRTGQMLELLAGEHDVTLLTPRPALHQPAPPAFPRGVRVVTYDAPAAGGGAAANGAGSPGSRSGGALTTRAGGLVRALARGLPLQSGLFHAPDLGRQLRRLAPEADLVVLQLARLALHRDDCGATPVVIDLIDDLALNFERRAALDHPWLRPILALEARRLARAQRNLAAGAAAMLLVCDRDRRTVRGRLTADGTARLATVRLVIESRDPIAAEATVSNEPPGLVFTGNLGYFVNADAITWWLREVWPRVVERHPEVRLVVAGDRPARRVRLALATAPGSVRLVASPPDLVPLLVGATAALAPLRGGSGVPVKILEAWAAGTPVIASAWAAQGTTAEPGSDLLVADTPEEWIEALDRLLGSSSTRRRLVESGRRRLAADYSRETVRRQLLEALATARGAGSSSGGHSSL